MGRTCRNKGISRDCVEATVTNCLKDIIFNEQFIPAILKRYNEALAHANASIAKQLSTINNKITGITKSINNIINAVEINGSTSLLTRLTELEEQKKALEKQRDEIAESNAIKPVTVEQLTALVNTAKTLLSQGDFPARRRLIETFLEKVVVYQDRVEILLNAAPFVDKGDYTKYTQTISRQKN